MKLAKLSMVAIAVLGLGGHVYAADTLEEAFKNGKVTGDLRFVYTAGSQTDAATQTAPVNNVDVGSIAVELKYVTDKFQGFNLGVAFQSAHDLGFHKNDYNGTPGAQPASEDDERNSVSTTLLSEAYLQYNFLKSNIAIGRQKIKTPLIMTSSAFALEDSFDAAILTFNEIPDTMIKLMYIQDWQMRYGDEARNTGTQQDMHLEKGIYSAFFKNKSIKGLTLDGQYMTTNEDKRFFDAPVFVGTGGYDQYYLQAEYKLPINFPLSLAATYAGADYESRVFATPAPGSEAGGDNARLYGFKVGTEVTGVKLNLAYTTMDDEANFPGTLGHVPDTIAYTDMLTNNAIFAGVDAYSIEAIYGFGIPGFSSALKYAHYDQSEKGIMNSGSSAANRMNLDGADEINIDLKYAFTGALRGFHTRLWAGYGTYDNPTGAATTNDDDFLYGRFYLNYKF